MAESGGGAVARIVRQLQPAGPHSASVPVLEGVERSAAGSSTEGARTSRSSGMGKVLEMLLPYALVMLRVWITAGLGGWMGGEGGCCGVFGSVEGSLQVVS